MALNMHCTHCTFSAPVPGAFPLSVAAVRLTPADFKDLPYSPALLLPVRFSATLTSDPEYILGCEEGFGMYFVEMWSIDSAGNWGPFVNCFYTYSEIQEAVVEHFVDAASFLTFAWRVGYCLGWLSALALTDRDLALVGFSLLSVLVDRLSGAPLCC